MPCLWEQVNKGELLPYLHAVSCEFVILSYTCSLLHTCIHIRSRSVGRPMIETDVTYIEYLRGLRFSFTKIAGNKYGYPVP